MKNLLLDTHTGRKDRAVRTEFGPTGGRTGTGPRHQEPFFGEVPRRFPDRSPSWSGGFRADRQELLRF